MTLTDRVLNHLKRNGKITSMVAFKNYGVTRISVIIDTLRKQGYNITTEMKSGKNRYGDPCHYGEFVLHDKEGVK